MTYRGRGVLYGLNTTTAGSSSLSASCSFQSTDWSGKVDEETILNCDGEVMTHITKNPSETLTVSYVFTGGTNTGTATMATVDPGAVITITDANQPDVAGTWLVNTVSEKRTNTSAAIIDLSCIRYTGITY